MFVKIQDSPIGGKGNNSGSCVKLVEYLGKENEGKSAIEKESFFSHNQQKHSPSQVLKAIDKNKGQLKKHSAKFFSLILSPSQKELLHIGDDSDLLKEYTRKVMNEYAKNFKKGLTADDLVYFAKVEYNRSAKGDEAKIKSSGDKYKSGEQLEGDNRHVHIIVSRKDKSNTKKLSPMGNARGKEAKTPTGKMAATGFDRSNFIQECETTYDTLFEYKRAREDTYEHRNIMKNGSREAKRIEQSFFNQRPEKAVSPTVHKDTSPVDKPIAVRELTFEEEIEKMRLEQSNQVVPRIPKAQENIAPIDKPKKVTKVVLPIVPKVEKRIIQKKATPIEKPPIQKEPIPKSNLEKDKVQAEVIPKKLTIREKNKLKSKKNEQSM